MSCLFPAQSDQTVTKQVQFFNCTLASSRALQQSCIKTCNVIFIITCLSTTWRGRMFQCCRRKNLRRSRRGTSCWRRWGPPSWTASWQSPGTGRLQCGRQAQRCRTLPPSPAKASACTMYFNMLIFKWSPCFKCCSVLAGNWTAVLLSETETQFLYYFIILNSIKLNCSKLYGCHRELSYIEEIILYLILFACAIKIHVTFP